MVKIDMQTATKLYESGSDIMIVPCKISVSNLWAVKVANINRDGIPLDVLVNAHTTFMCSEKNGLTCSLYADSI